MKAVILAGGRGERLRPITDTRPKPLVPVLARPVMDYCLSLIAHHGFREAYVTTHYLADQIRHRYGESAFGMKLFYSMEETPLGTAGGVKCLEEHLKEEECFLVMSGDALCDFDLTRAVLFHKEKKADVTIVLSSVKTPLEFGVVLSDTFEKIFAFSEKPDWCETFSDLVNTGVYLLSPSVLKKIPSGKVFDFSHDLFPLLLKEGYSLYGYKDEGYWCDIGKIPTLYRCNIDVLAGRAKTYLPPEGRKVRSADGKGYYFVSNGARVDEGAEIQSGTVIANGAHLARDSRVSGSLLLENTTLEKGSLSRDAVLCEGTVLRENAMALSGSVLGAGSVVAEGETTERGKKYPPFSVVKTDAPFREEGLVFTETGVSSGFREGLDRAETEQLGYAFAHSFHRDIAVVWDERKKESAYFATLFAGGVVSAGHDAILLGEGTEHLASFGAGRYRHPTVFISATEDRSLIYGYKEDSFPLTRKDVLRLLRDQEGKREKECGKVLSTSGLREEYRAALRSEMGEGKGFSVVFHGDRAKDLRETAILCGFRAYDGTREEPFVLEVYDGLVKLFLSGKRCADTEKIRLYLIEKALESGTRDFVLPSSVPALFAEHIRSRGGRVRTVSLEQTNLDQKEERERAKKEKWLYDPAFLAAKLLGTVKEKSPEQIEREFASTPDIFISQLRYVPKEENKAKLVRLMGREPVDEKDRKVRITPGFWGIKIVSEAMSFEAALDMAFECRGKINEIEQTIGGR